MKKIILVIGATMGLLLAGCNQGGTSDQYNTGNGAGSSSNANQNATSHGTNAP